MRKFLKYMLSIICMSFVGGMITLFIGNHYDRLQRMEYEKEREEFHIQWKTDKENKVIEKRKLFSQLVTTCILSPYWKEYKEDYLQMAENSGLDMSSKMFDEMIFSDYSYSIVERFIKKYYHRDSNERELLRSYNSPALSYDLFENQAIPERLSYFDVYKKCLPDRLSFIQKQKPEDSALQVFTGMAIVLSIICIIYLGLKKT